MNRPALALVALLAAMPLTASAQAVPPAPPPGPTAAPASAPGAGAPALHRRWRYMQAVRALTLSPDQKQQIMGFVRATRAANHGADRSTRHANVKKLRGEIDGILTPDQRAQVQTQLEQQRATPPAQ